MVTVRARAPPEPTEQYLYNMLLWFGLEAATLAAAKITKLEWLKYVSLLPFTMVCYNGYKLLKAKGVF